ncbi:hypothetical protein ACOME3_006744 [Neoechinorhynchus agilis]
MQRMPLNAELPTDVQGGYFTRVLNPQGQWCGLTKDQRLPAGNVMQAAAQGGYYGSATNLQGSSKNPKILWQMQRMPMNAVQGDILLGCSSTGSFNKPQDIMANAANAMNACVPTDVQGGYFTRVLNPQGQFQQTPKEYYDQMQRMKMNADVPTDVQGGYFTRVLNPQGQS